MVHFKHNLYFLKSEGHKLKYTNALTYLSTTKSSDLIINILLHIVFNISAHIKVLT